MLSQNKINKKISTNKKAHKNQTKKQTIKIKILLLNLHKNNNLILHPRYSNHLPNKVRPKISLKPLNHKQRMRMINLKQPLKSNFNNYNNSPRLRNKNHPRLKTKQKNFWLTSKFSNLPNKFKAINSGHNNKLKHSFSSSQCKRKTLKISNSKLFRFNNNYPN